MTKTRRKLELIEKRLRKIEMCMELMETSILELSSVIVDSLEDDVDFDFEQPEMTSKDMVKLCGKLRALPTSWKSG